MPEETSITLDAGFSFTSLYRPVFEVLTDDGWLDVRCYVHQAEVQRGRERFTDHFDPATATAVLDNRDGTFDMIAPPDVLATSPLRPGRQIRVGVEGLWDLPVFATLSTRWLFAGFVDSCKPTYDPVLEDIVTIDAIDALGDVGRIKLAAVADVGAGELTNVRVNRILDAAEQPADRRNVSTGSAVALVATTFGSQVIDELGRTADSSGGVVFGDFDAGITYKDRDWMVWRNDTEPDGHIGNIDPIDCCPTGFETSFDRAQLTTEVEIGRKVPTGDPPETPVIYEDTAAIALYGRETFTRTDLLCADPTTMFPLLAGRWLAIRGITSMPRVEAVTFSAATDRLFTVSIATWGWVVATYATWTDLMADRATWGDLPTGEGIQHSVTHLMGTCMPELPSRYRCHLRTESGRLIFDRVVFAAGVRHSVTRDDWTLRVALDAAEWASHNVTAEASMLGAWGALLGAVTATKYTTAQATMLGAWGGMTGTVTATVVTPPTLVLMEPFDNFTFAPWSNTGGSISASGRTGNAAQVAGAANRIDYTIPTGSQHDWITIGFAWRVNTTTTNPCGIVQLFSVGTVLENKLTYNGNTSKSLTVTRGSTALATSATGLINPSTWYYIELRVRLHDTLGSMEVMLDGVSVISVTGQDTKTTTNTVYDSVRLSPFLTGITQLWDDLYIETGTSAPPFLGSQTI